MWLGDVLGVIFLAALIWWLIQREDSPLVVRILGPIAFGLWIAGHVLRGLGVFGA